MKYRKTFSAIVSSRKLLIGALALGLLVPSDTFAMDSPPRKGDDSQASRWLSLPPVPHLETMRWMNWTPSAPIFKVDTLLVPDVLQPGKLRSPLEIEAGLPRAS